MSADIPGIGLTDAIGDASPYQFAVFGRNVGKPIHSATKLRIFYWGVAIILIVATVAAQAGALDTSHTEPKSTIEASSKASAASFSSQAPVISNPGDRDSALVVIDAWAAGVGKDELPPGIGELGNALWDDAT